MPLRKAYRFRIDPDAAQEELFRLTIGCCRLVYNLCLDQKISERERGDATLHSSKSAGLYSRLLSPQKAPNAGARRPGRNSLKIAPYHLATCILSLDTHRLDQYFSGVLRVRCSGTVISLIDEFFARRRRDVSAFLRA